MFKTPTIVLSSGLLFSFMFGCERAADEQKDAVNAQQEANQEIAEAHDEARDKAVGAQAEADKKIAEAQEGFTKMREDFRHETTTKLAELDKEIAELEAKSPTLNGKEKTDLDTNLSDIRTQREQFSKDYQGIETATATTWDATKERLDKQLKALEDAIDKAD